MNLTLTRAYIATCGRCGAMTTVTRSNRLTASQAALDLRENGWSKTKAFGWTCPDCKREARLA